VLLCRANVSAWEEAMDNSLIEQKPTVYASEILAASTTAMSSQDFNWMSVAKAEPAPGLQLAELYSIQYYSCHF